MNGTGTTTDELTGVNIVLREFHPHLGVSSLLLAMVGSRSRVYSRSVLVTTKNI